LIRLWYILFYHFHKIDYISDGEHIKMWEIIDKNVLFNNVRAAAVTPKGYNTLGSIGTKISNISHFFECVLNVLDKSTHG